MFKLKLPETEAGLRQFKIIRDDLTLSRVNDIADGFRACGLVLNYKNGIGKIENCQVRRAKLYNDLTGDQLRILSNAFNNGVCLFLTVEKIKNHFRDLTV